MDMGKDTDMDIQRFLYGMSDTNYDRGSIKFFFSNLPHGAKNYIPIS
jgi:hypothetical protein